MGEVKEIPESEQLVEKPSKKISKGPGKIARNVAGVGAAIVAGVTGAVGVEAGSPSTAHAQEKPGATATLPARAPTRTVEPTRTLTPAPSPTSGKDKITMPIDNLNEVLETQVQGRLNVRATEVAKQPTPTPVVIEKPIPVVVDRGPGFGDRVFDWVTALLAGSVALIRNNRLQAFFDRLIHSRIGSRRQPNPPPASPAGGPPAGAPPVHP